MELLFLKYSSLILCICFWLCSCVFGHLTQNDLNYIKTSLLNLENKQTGLFSEDENINLMIVEVTQILKIDINKKKSAERLNQAQTMQV